MKIILLRPSMGGVPAGDAMEPLVFAILRRLTPPGVEMVLRDERLAVVDCCEPADLVAMTVETHGARRAYQLASAFRRRGVPVLMGGYHPTLLPEEAQAYADALVLGDAEAVWPRVLKDLSAGRLKGIYRGDPGAQVPSEVDRGIFSGKPYRPLSLVQHGRGCPFSCDFCSVSSFYGGRLSDRPLARVTSEIASLRRRHILFVDDNLFADPQRAAALCEALVPLRVRWSCQISIDVAADGRMLDLMARSGCFLVLVGFESLDPANLKQMGKGVNLAHGDYAGAVEQFRRRGIMVYGTFLFGYDHDTPASIGKALDFARRSRLCLANFNPLTPFPGTPLYARLKGEGRLIRDPWWLDPDYRYGQALFHPEGMSARELEDGCFRARRAFHALPSILQRGCDWRSNARTPGAAALFLAANLVSRREMLRKQGLGLGGGLSSVLAEDSP